MCPVIDFDPTEAVSFDLVEPATYPMKILEIEEQAEGDKCNYYLPVVFGFLDPELSKKAGKVWRNYPLDGKGASFFKELVKKACGVNLDEPGKFDTDDLVGKELTCEVGHNTHEGVTRNDIKKIIG